MYEQDWLNQNALPATTNLTDQDAFMDDMASAMAAKGIDMQYCMPLPRHYLQGSKYANLTTTRVSVDRFSSPRYEDFLFVSLLTSSLGAWPWSDTFNSTEIDNLLLSTLSAGMVGVGDQIGTASAANLLQAVRSDGVIVKPDVPIVPLDQTFLDQASGVDTPLVAATYTDFGGMRASYVYAFNVGTNATASFTPAALGYSGQVFVYDYFQRTGTPRRRVRGVHRGPERRERATTSSFRSGHRASRSRAMRGSSCRSGRSASRSSPTTARSPSQSPSRPGRRA